MEGQGLTGSLGASAASRRLTGLRSRLGAGFDQKCRVETPGPEVSNGAGGTYPGEPVVLSNVDCQVRFPRSNPATPDGEAAQTTIQRVEIRLPVGTPVSVKSRIVVGDQAYEVQGHDSGRSYASEVVCDCLRANDGA